MLQFREELSAKDTIYYKETFLSHKVIHLKLEAQNPQELGIYK